MLVTDFATFVKRFPFGMEYPVGAKNHSGCLFSAHSAEYDSGIVTVTDGRVVEFLGANKNSKGAMDFFQKKTFEVTEWDYQELLGKGKISPESKEFLVDSLTGEIIGEFVHQGAARKIRCVRKEWFSTEITELIGDETLFLTYDHFTDRIELGNNSQKILDMFYFQKWVQLSTAGTVGNSGYALNLLADIWNKLYPKNRLSDQLYVINTFSELIGKDGVEIPDTSKVAPELCSAFAEYKLSKLTAKI